MKGALCEMKTMHIVVICFVAGLLGWWCLEYAEAASWMMLERNVAISNGVYNIPDRTSEIMLESVKKHIQREPSTLLLTLMMFQAPTLLVALSRRYTFLHYATAGIVVILLCIDVGVAMNPRGGDFKGCTNCDGVFLMHLGFGSLAYSIALLLLLVAGIGALNRRRRS